MPLTDEEKAELEASPELAKFNKVLALYAYNAVAYVAAGSSVQEIKDRAAYATATTIAASGDLSPFCPVGCYWNAEIGACLCDGIEQSSSATSRTGKATGKKPAKKKKPSKTKKTGKSRQS